MPAENSMETAYRIADERSAAIVRSFIATWNTHSVSATMELLDPDIEFRSPLFADPVLGIEARKREVENFLTSMPDFAFTLIRIATDGDFVATELVGTGTSTGPAKLPGRDPIPPTGRHVEFGMAGFFRVTTEQKIAEERYYYDRLELIQQLNPAS
jgi:predicted ester cyclase